MTLGGGSHGKYRYLCNSCDTMWSQIPPHFLEESDRVELLKTDLFSTNDTDNDDPLEWLTKSADLIIKSAEVIDKRDADSDIVISNKRRAKPYLCGKCKQPKKGHTCPQIVLPDSFKSTFVPSNF